MRAAFAVADFAILAAIAAFLAAPAGCDSSVRVGELRPEASPPAPTENPNPPLEIPDAGTKSTSWKLVAPTVPCTVYALAERRADDLYVGCNGGRIYRFDGVKAQLAYEVEDTSVFSLLWVADDGQVWAGAQQHAAKTADTPKAPTQLHHFDGTRWSTVGDASKRIAAIAGAGEDVWIATETQILRREGATLVPVFTTAKGVFRACSFAAPDNGSCVGTEGLAVAWDGKTWSAVTGGPWTTAAEVFGVEVDSLDKSSTFFYGEPITDSHGDHACRATRRSGGTFSTQQASAPCFASSYHARKRTGSVYVNGRKLSLLAVDENYGGVLAFDLGADTVVSVCGAVLAFSNGSANTRAGGLYGLITTLVGTGGGQIALNAAAGPNLNFNDLSVAPDGTAWARVEDQTVCGSITDRLVRFENASWAPVAAPQGALSGIGLAAVASDRAYTIDLGRGLLLSYAGAGWVDGPLLDDAFSIGAAKRDDVWVGTTHESFGHFDGKTFTPTKPPGKLRQVEQIVPVGADVWMVQAGVTQGDTDQHIVRYANGATSEWNAGVQVAGAQVRISALDASHVYASGSPAQAWDGTTWKLLDFDANAVWARAAGEVYFADRGDIWRWNGHRRDRVYHGFIPIRTIEGGKDHGFAVGPGSLTIEFATRPDDPR